MGGVKTTLIDHRSDEFLVKKLHQLLDKAEIVIAQNGDRFDIRKIRTRMIKYGLPPPSPFRTIDTLKVARRYFGFTFNSLNELAIFLGIKGKIKTNKELWFGCMEGEANALKKMARYNQNDVRVLKEVYLKLRPWITNHPNLGIYSEKNACPKCGSRKLERRGYQYNNTTKYARIKCKDCAGWSRLNINLNENKQLTSI